MTREALLATGEVADTPQGIGCSTCTLDAGGSAAYSEALGGVVAIVFADQMTTSQGITLGATVAEVRDAYPDAPTSVNGYLVPRINADTHYEMGFSDTVTEIILTKDNQDCFG